MSAFLDRFFHISARGSDVRTELAAGVTTFLTMAYIIVAQPAVMSGQMLGVDTGIDFGSVMTATCLAAALATLMMGLWAKAPIAQAPGMGENFFLTLTLIPAAAAAGFANAWQVALGVVFVAGILFLLVTLVGAQKLIVEAIGTSLAAGISTGIGLFIAFIGLRNAGLVIGDPGTLVRLSTDWTSPGLVVFFTGLFTTAALHVRHVRGAILLGIVTSTIAALALKAVMPVRMAAAGLELPGAIVAAPPSLAPTFLAMDLAGAMSMAMLPFVVMFLIMDMFDTVGTLVGVTEGVGVDSKTILPEPQRAYLSDAVGTVAGAALGTSTVTSFVESASGIEQGGRTGLTSVMVAVLFLLALFVSPVVSLLGSYPPITAPALVMVGAMMMRSMARIDWHDASEAIPAFLIALGIPLAYSVSDGLALGFVAYPVIKVMAGRAAELRWPMIVTSVVMFFYIVVLRGGV